MRRNIKVILLLALLGVMTLVVSCGKNNKTAKEDMILEGKIAVATDKEHEPQIKLAADRFKKLNEKVEIDIKVREDINNNFEYILKNHNNPVDIISIDDGYVKYAVNKNIESFLEVTEDINDYKSGLLDNNINTVTVDGKIYGFPWDTYPKAIIYRRDMFSSYGINQEDIKTWSDYIEAGRIISKATKKAFMANVENNNSDIYLILANQLGSCYFNKDGKSNFSSKEWMRAHELVKIFYEEGLIVDFNSKTEIIRKAKEDKVISFIADPTYAVELMKSSPEANEKWGVMKMPAFEPGGNRDISLGGINLMINKKTSNAKLAKEFIKFSLTDEHLQVDLLNEYGRFPVFKSTYDFIDFNKEIVYFNNSIWRLFASVEKGAFKINYTSYFPIIREKTKPILSGPNIKDKDIKTILDSIEKDLENKM